MHSDDIADHDIEWLGQSREDVEMAVGPVRLRGVYNITETTPGMTAEYMAEQRAAQQDGNTNQYADYVESEQDLSQYAVGTLLRANDSGELEPVLDGEGNRIQISEDQLAEETYREEGAIILADDPETDENEAGRIVDQNGNNILDGQDNPRHVSEGGYTIVTEEDQQQDGENSDDSSDDSSDSEGDGEGDGGQNENPMGGGPTGGGADTPQGSDDGAQSVPEGSDSIEKPPRELTVEAYCSDDTWEQLNDLRDQDRPFDVAIGEFTIDRMGILDLSRVVAGDQYAANDVTISLKQFQDITVRVPGSGGGGGGGGQQTDGQIGSAPDSVQGWIDQNNDGVDDITGLSESEYEQMQVVFAEDFENDDYPSIFSSTVMQGTHDSVVSDTAHAGSGALRVDIPSGNHYGMDTVSDPQDLGATSQNVRDMYASYWVRFGSGFSHPQSFASKLPGFENHERRSSGSAGNPSDGTNGWAARGMFSNGGSGGVQVGAYVYHMDQSGGYGDKVNGATLSPGQWYRIDQHVRLNTVSGGDANSDGVLQMWINGTQVIDRQSMRYTLYPENGINYAFQVYYGGGEPSPQDNTVYIDALQLQTPGSGGGGGGGGGGGQ